MIKNLIQEWQTQEKAYSPEGSAGVKNLARLCRAIGYKDDTYFGQFEKGSYGDLIAFLEDNPGVVLAIKEWIVAVDDKEWAENLEGQLNTEEA